jgi:Kef-type K+ transport system membrane component KefB
VDQSNLLLTIGLLLVAAKLGGAVSRRFGLPTVFGKLCVGLLVGPAVLHLVTADQSLNSLADLGIILLMFIAGLETDVDQMRKVGKAAFLAAYGGVILPMAAGTGFGLLYGLDTPEALFLGTVLTATSVGITAQTLQELGKLRSREGSAILAAAVIDDVMGVIVLSLVLGFSDGGDPLIPIGKMALYIPLAFAAGIFILPWIVERIRHLHDQETRIGILIGIALGYAWAAEHWGGLAAITGAYIAGLVVQRTELGEHATESVNRIGYAFFIPLFFVVVGLRMDSSALRDAPLFALGLIAIAIVTKIVGAFGGAMAGGFNASEATRVGYGMVSRGEVALVVAVIGLDRGLVSQETFSATILMTLVTTLVTPLLLKWVYRQRSAESEPEIEAAAAAGLLLADAPAHAGGGLVMAESIEA